MDLSSTKIILNYFFEGKAWDMARIFWVEDQSHWVEKFKKTLELAEFDDTPNHLDIFKFAESAKQHIALANDEKKPNIAILDAKMNGLDQAGLSVSKALQKKWPGLPIIFLSEHNGTDIEREALEQFNVSDFISKHQKNIEEVLCWRIKAVLRQEIMQSSVVNTQLSNAIVDGDLRIDLDTWEVYWKGSKLMNPDNHKRSLSPTPRKILRFLVERSPRPVTTFQMAEALETDPDKYSYATYRQHIKTLRRSFDAAENGDGSFVDACKKGIGIAAAGDEGAYCWKSIK